MNKDPQIHKARFRHRIPCEPVTDLQHLSYCGFISCNEFIRVLYLRKLRNFSISFGRLDCDANVIL